MPRTAWARLAGRGRAFRAARGGVAAVEFALLLPIMLTAYLGTVEVCQGIAIKRKVTLVSRALADLTAQGNVVTDADRDTILQASTVVMMPYPGADLSLSIASVIMNNDGSQARVVWSERSGPNAPTYSRCQDVTAKLPAEVRRPNTTVIMGEGSYTYRPLNLFDPVSNAIWGASKTGMQLSERTVMAPRQVSSVPRKTTGSPTDGWIACP